MPSPRLEQLASQCRGEAEARAERFIACQLAGLAGLGLSAEALAREEALLRGGLLAKWIALGGATGEAG